MQQDNQYLVDILQAAQRIVEKTTRLTVEDFYADIKVQDSVVRRLLSISKAARRISPEMIRQFDTLPWEAMKTLKDQLSHQDNDIDPDVLWTIVHTEIPTLIHALQLRPVPDVPPPYSQRQFS